MASVAASGRPSANISRSKTSRQPVKRSEAAERAQLNPRPPDAEPARSAGGADAVGWGSAGASTPCDSLGGRVTTPSSNHARFWASVS